jgi:hypothetical protein
MGRQVCTSLWNVMNTPRPRNLQSMRYRTKTCDVTRCYVFGGRRVSDQTTAHGIFFPHRLRVHQRTISPLTRHTNQPTQIRCAPPPRCAPPHRKQHHRRPLQRRRINIQTQTGLPKRRVVRPPLRRRRHLLPHARRDRRPPPHKTSPPPRRAPHRPPTRALPRRLTGPQRRHKQRCRPMGWHRRRGKQKEK